MSKDFVHLHVHSDYSFLDGAVSIPKLVKKASDLKMKALALTDHGNMSGAVEFYKHCVKEGIKPLIGMEAYVDPKGISAKSKISEFRHLTLLCKSDEGYRNLVKLSSKAFLDGLYWGRARVDIDILQSHANGLIALGGCMSGEVPRRILSGDESGAIRFARLYSDIFGGDFYLELMDIGLPENEFLNKSQIEVAKKAGIGVVATNDVHFLDQGDHQAHEALLCINTKKTFEDKDRLTSPEGIYFRSQQEMFKLFKNCPQALENTVKIADKCSFEMKLNPNSPRLPDFQIPSGFKNPMEYLEYLTWEGAKKRFRSGISAEAESRIKKELEVIAQTGYAGYFLIIADIVMEAKKNNIRVGPGRGSAVGSLVLYCLDIITINPMNYGLLFERFLNPERITAPDIDLDFADDKRGMVIDYMVRRFGEKAVCYIGTAASLGARQVVRDVAKVLGLTPKEIDVLSSKMPETYFIDKPPEDPRSDVEWIYSKNLNGFKAQIDSDERLERLVSIASRLEGLKRQPGIHAAGFIIAPGDLTDFVPLRKDKLNQIVCQFDMDSITDVGLIKVDILGLTALSAMEKTALLVSGKEEIDFDELPLDDEKTFEMISSGETKGIFQLESKGMRNLCVQLKPKSIPEIIAIISLYRPGPMDHIDKFIARKYGREKVDLIHSSLKDILKETFGIPIYQEQVMQITSTVAGYNLGKADILRRAMGKKKRDVMESEKENFLAGANERGIDKKTAVRIWEMLEPFAGYGFNKSHGAGYAFLAYYTAFLKTHHTLEFFAATMTTEISNTDKIAEFIDEARRLKINIFPPSINYSGVNFVVEKKGVRYALGAVKNVGEKAAQEIVEERVKAGSFVDFDDFLGRVNFTSATKRTVEYLIKAGAFDEFELNRKKLLDSMENSFERALSRKKQKMMGQMPLFSEREFSKPEAAMNKGSFWTYQEKKDAELEAFGFNFSVHPLDEYKRFLNFRGMCRLSDYMQNGFKDCFTAGLLMKTESKDGGMLLFLEDNNSKLEVFLSPEKNSDLSAFAKENMGKLIAVKGRIRNLNQGKMLLADECKSVEEALNLSKKSLEIELKDNTIDDSFLKSIKDMIISHEGDCGVYFLLKEKNRNIKMKSDLSVCFDMSLVNEIQSIIENKGKVKYVAEINC